MSSHIIELPSPSDIAVDALMRLPGQKLRDKTFGWVTFLKAEDAQIFLEAHGQVRDASRKRLTRVSRATVFLKCMDRDVYFERSTKPADTLLLRVLAKEEKDKKEQSDDKTTANSFRTQPSKGMFTTNEYPDLSIQN